jgi:hypothetical protein
MVVIQLLEEALRRDVAGEVRFDAGAKSAYASDALNLGTRARDRGLSSPRTRNRYSELLVYTFAAAGLIYLAQFVTKGTF